MSGEWEHRGVIGELEWSRGGLESRSVESDAFAASFSECSGGVNAKPSTVSFPNASVGNLSRLWAGHPGRIPTYNMWE